MPNGSSNTARGGDWDRAGEAGGSGRGGGLYVSNGTVTLTNVTLSSNAAWGGKGKSTGGWAYGGALFVRRAG